jgi:hypothetical protein
LEGGAEYEKDIEELRWLQNAAASVPEAEELFRKEIKRSAVGQCSHFVLISRYLG